jgi:hypothetical protein
MCGSPRTRAWCGADARRVHAVPAGWSSCMRSR